MPTDRVILHVIESYGAGSARAAETYANATPEYRHVVLRRPRDGEYVEGQEARAFAQVHDLPGGFLPALRTIRRIVREVRPYRIHAHSSWGGAFARIALPTRVARNRVVYTPHCFAFERLDLPAPARIGFAIAEFLLALKTDVIAACSTREADLARRMPSRRAPVVVPNVGSLPPSEEGARRSGRLVGIGRLGNQKDPALFGDIASAAQRVGTIDEALWLGGGEPEAENGLARSGVTVTGWLDTGQIAGHCRTAGVYLHTARWEGFPLSILEAYRAGLPVVARRIPALEPAPQQWLFDTKEQAIDLLARLLDPNEVAANRAAWAAALADNEPSVQRVRLNAVYARVSR